MKAIVVRKAGGPEVLSYEDVPTPQVKPGWSLVQVKGFGINHSEIFTRKGLSPSVKFPRILGIECVGVVADSTSDELAVGQKVISIMGEMGRAFDGSYAEYVLLPNEQIYPVQTDLDWSDLAAVPETFYTAFGSLKHLQLKPEDTILIRSGASGVGISALRLIKAKYPDMQVTGSVRSLKKQDVLLDAGYDAVIEDKDGKLQTTEKFSKVLELVGPATLKDTFNHVLPYGIVCNTGELGGQWYMDGFDPISDIHEGALLTSLSSGEVNSQKLNEMLDYIKQYHVEVSPTKVYRLDQVREAHEYLESGHNLGKVVVVN
ncbi:zinc-binding alcohol dehydrogenase family protein [Companilactobacillus sp. HBUAS56275]|uniref:Zinc-binding alcohol dehydrogenase family protein n=1 Tax=Candidatus Companilactobacillus pullicola TaxID=2838523 RepID=A0A9D2CMV6_9LACO|nr:zinc-binding alcohol dehydrogenase family protein [Candidatus Companilactobacillus pullicola]